VNKIVIREAGEPDLATLADLWNRLDQFHHDLGMAFPQTSDASKKWVDSFRRTLGRFSFAWIAEDQGQAKAFLLGRVKQSPAFLGSVQVGEISDLYVDDELRGSGVGAELAEMAMSKFKALGIHSVEVQILAGNKNGFSFWEKLGFKEDLSLVRKELKDT
jgi:phosphinothricin acetyltransferase